MGHKGTDRDREPGRRLAAQHVCRGGIGTGDAAPVVAVPEDAVIDTGTRQVVILDRGEGRFEPREVKAGQRGDGFTEIREGLSRATASSSRPLPDRCREQFEGGIARSHFAGGTAMIARLIGWSACNLVPVSSVRFAVAVGLYALKTRCLTPSPTSTCR